MHTTKYYTVIRQITLVIYVIPIQSLWYLAKISTYCNKTSIGASKLVRWKSRKTRFR